MNTIEQLAAAMMQLQTQNGSMQTALQTVSNQATAALARAEAAETALAARLPSSSSDKLRHVNPKPFTGETNDPEALLNFAFDLRMLFQSCNVQDATRQLSHAITLLDGPAKICWRSHADNTSDALGQPTAQRCTTFSELITCILEPEFTSHNRVQNARYQLLACKQNGSVTDYVQRFRQIALRIPKLTDEERLFQFQNGLKGSLANDLAKFPPADFATACAMAERMDSSSRARLNPTSNTFTPNNYSFTPSPPPNYPQHDTQSSYATPMDINSMHTVNRPSAANHASNSQRPRFTPLTPAERERLHSVNACLYCREEHATHTAENCPKKRQSSNRRQ